MNNRLIILTEEDLHNIIRESVEKILNEVDGYEDVMKRANPAFDKSTLRGKITRALRPKKAQQFDKIHAGAKEMYDDAWSDESDNSHNYPSASDPYAVPSEEDRARRAKNNGIMHKYRLNQYGRRPYGYGSYCE